MKGTGFGLPVLAAICALAMTGVASAQQEGTLEQKRDKKLAEPFMKNAAWMTDYDKAREEAKKSGKLIFAYFCRSYAF